METIQNDHVKERLSKEHSDHVRKLCLTLKYGLHMAGGKDYVNATA